MNEKRSVFIDRLRNCGKMRRGSREKAGASNFRDIKYLQRLRLRPQRLQTTIHLMLEIKFMAPFSEGH